MTTVVFYCFPDGALRGFAAKGHAGEAETGQNIVCAAISAILQTTILGVQRIAGDDADIQADESAAAMHLMLQAPPSQAADVLLKTAYEGIKDIAAQYPEQCQVARRTPKLPGHDCANCQHPCGQKSSE